MNILYLCTDTGIPVLGRKGASVHVRALIAALARAGHAVALAAPVLTRLPWEAPAPVEASLLHLPPGEVAEDAARALQAFAATLETPDAWLPKELRRILYTETLPARLQRQLQDGPPDFIYERASLYGTAGVRLARELDVPLVLELNAPLAEEQATYRGTRLGELAARAECWMLERADAVLAVSSELREHTLALGADPSRVHVVPNGIDPALFRPGAPDGRLREQWGLAHGPILGFVGGLRPWHGVEALPDLLERLVPRYPGLHLVFVGDGPLRDELEADLRRRRLLSNATFAGSVPHEEVPAMIRLFDVALAPYPRLTHGFYFSPLKLFEYLACGVPVVAARLGQIADVVRDGETGLLYEAGDLDGLETACERLLADPSVARRLGQAAVRDVEARYSWDRNAVRVVELASRLVAEKRSALPQGVDS